MTQYLAQIDTNNIISDNYSLQKKIGKNSYSPIKQQGFTPMPDFIANRYGHYKHGDLDTYSALARLAAKEDRPLYPHIETIAKIARRSIRTVKRAIKKFQADLVLIVTKTGRASNYVMVPLLPTGFPDPESGEYIIAKAMAGCRQIPKNGDYLYAGNADYEVSKVPVSGVDMSPQECQSVTPEVPKCHLSYNKEETHSRNTATALPPSQPAPDPTPPPAPKPPVVVASFDEKIENELKQRPDIQREWVRKSLAIKGQDPDNIVAAIKLSATKNDPTAFIRSALEKAYRINAAPKVEITPEQQFAKNKKETSQDVYKDHVKAYESLSSDNKKIVFDAILETMNDYMKKYLINLGPDKCSKDKIAMSKIKTCKHINKLCYGMVENNANI